jgi:hypothetical protein
LRRRISTASMPISSAARSISRSMSDMASGRPAPRYEVSGVVLVNTPRVTKYAAGMS